MDIHAESPLLRVIAVCARVGEVKGWVAGCAVTKGGKEKSREARKEDTRVWGR